MPSAAGASLQFAARGAAVGFRVAHAAGPAAAAAARSNGAAPGSVATAPGSHAAAAPTAVGGSTDEGPDDETFEDMLCDLPSDALAAILSLRGRVAVAAQSQGLQPLVLRTQLYTILVRSCIG